MSFFSSAKNKEEVVLLVDIGSGSIGCAVVHIRPGTTPLIMSTLRLPFTVLDTVDGAKLVEGMAVLLEETLTMMVERGGIKGISSVLVTFCSPWFVFKTKHIVVSEDKPFVVSKDFLENMGVQEGQAFIKELTPDTSSPDAFELVEKSVVHAKINGYAIESTLGVKTKDFEASLSLSAIPQSILNIVRESVLKHAHVRAEKIFLHTFPLVSFSLIRDVYSSFSDFMIIDVTGEVTDVTLARDGAIVQTVSFPSGRNFLVRQVAKGLDVTPEIALSTLHTYAWKKADGETMSKVTEILTEAEKEWAVYFGDALESLSPTMVLPTNIFLTADSDTAPFFIDFLKVAKSDITATFRKNAHVTYLDHEVLGNLYEIPSTLVPDEFLIILAIFYSKMFRIH